MKKYNSFNSFVTLPGYTQCDTMETVLNELNTSNIRDVAVRLSIEPSRENTAHLNIMFSNQENNEMPNYEHNQIIQVLC